MIQKMTDEQIKTALSEGMSNQAAANKLGVGLRTFMRRKAKLVDTGFDPENDRFYDNPTSQAVKGYSTLHRHKSKDDSSTGKMLEWVKTNVAMSDQIEAARAAVEALTSDIEPLPLIPYNNTPTTKDRFTVIPIGDPHIGLAAWSKISGDEWNIKIANRVYKKVFTRLLKALPDTEECIFCNTGDFFHADNVAGVSTRSGHHFDLDGHHGKWLDAGFILIRMFVDACLLKYKKVEFINVPGNHDDILGRAIGTYIEQLYSHNPRLTVQKGDNPFQYVHRGKILLGFAHGHTARLPSLPGKMADDQAVLWGKTTYRHWITGHVHHKSWLQYKEHPGCKVETVGIIPPKDAYAHGAGYGAGRGIQGIVFDKRVGYSPVRNEESVRGDD